MAGSGEGKDGNSGLEWIECGQFCATYPRDIALQGPPAQTEHLCSALKLINGSRFENNFSYVNTSLDES